MTHWFAALVVCAITRGPGAPAQSLPDPNEDACTSILVSAGASTDGSVMITYSADAPFLPRLLHVPGGTHPAGATVDVWGWESDDVRGQIPEAPVTYSVVGLMNEHQLALGETTTGGRRELRNPAGLLDYDALMLLTLQRARSAREAIETIDRLVTEHGYGSSGETISIADETEAWMMEIIGKGPGVPGAVWVAARIPDGCISAHANMSRIREFPLDDPDNWLYAPDVVDFAVERGYWDPDGGAPFRFRDAYHPDASVATLRACATRVWSVYRRAAPGTDFPVDYHRGVAGAEDYPLFVRPDAKLSAHDVMQLMRDHYEGTPYDMTQGLAAGPFGSPMRFRGLGFELDGRRYSWERPISTQQAGFVMLAQCRAWLPDPVGGVYWFTPDDPYTSCFTPFYCGIEALPVAYTTGDHDRCSLDSAWWVFNVVSNLTYDRWSRVLPDVQAVQRESERAFFEMLPLVDRTAAALAERDPELMRRYLTEYSVRSAERLFDSWRELAMFVMTKHNDGYVNDIVRRPRGVGYPEDWLRRVLAEVGAELAVDGVER
jgi:dipeptidase